MTHGTNYKFHSPDATFWCRIYITDALTWLKWGCNGSQETTVPKTIVSQLILYVSCTGMAHKTVNWFISIFFRTKI